MSRISKGIDRRDILKTSALALGGALLTDSAEAYPRAVNTNSSPSTLKITDLRVATVVKPGPSPCPIIRIDTNQGVYGLGEVRDYRRRDTEMRFDRGYLSSFHKRICIDSECNGLITSIIKPNSLQPSKIHL